MGKRGERAAASVKLLEISSEHLRRAGSERIGRGLLKVEYQRLDGNGDGAGRLERFAEVDKVEIV